MKQSQITFILTTLIQPHHLNPSFDLSFDQFWGTHIPGMRLACYQFETLGREKDKRLWDHVEGGGFRLSDVMVAKGFITGEMYDVEVRKWRVMENATRLGMW